MKFCGAVYIKNKRRSNDDLYIFNRILSDFTKNAGHAKHKGFFNILA